jgi:hypothetical protein
VSDHDDGLYRAGDLVQVRVQRELRDCCEAHEADAVVVEIDGPRCGLGVSVQLVTAPVPVQGAWMRGITSAGLDVIRGGVEALMEATVFDRLTGVALRARKDWAWIRIMAKREKTT